MAVRQAADRAELATLLGADRFYAAYAIGLLEDGPFARSEWAIADGPDQEPAVGVVYRGYQPHFGFLAGPAQLVRDLLAEGLRPHQAYFACRSSHLGELRSFYRTGPEDRMIRMRVSAETFRPVSTQAAGSGRSSPTGERRPRTLVRLTAQQVSTVNRLYAHGVGAILTKTLMEEGLYYGIFEGSELVAVAGTHFIAPTYGLAAVGNVFTHPGHRGRGLATACTSAVTAALLARCPDVVLNVNANNEPARRAYRRLGFQDHCSFVEVFGTRRDGSPLRSLISRVFGAE